jgi:uncharacterized protein (UPF0333 family)
MKSTFSSILIGIVIIAIIGLGGYYVVKKFTASADVEVGNRTVSADFNGDGKIDALDLNSLINAMEAKSTDAKFDLNSDGKVDSLDLNIFITQYSTK